MKIFEDSDEPWISVHRCWDACGRRQFRAVLCSQQTTGLDGVGLTVSEAIDNAFLKKGRE